MCPYGYYKKPENYNREMIYCNKDDDLCLLTRYCNKDNKIVQSDFANRCKKLSIENNIPKNASLVRISMSNKDFLYVDVKEKDGTYTYKLANPFDNIPNYVYVVKNDKNEYNIKKIDE